MWHAKLLIMHAHSSWVIGGSDGEEPVSLQSFQALWALKFLTNLKIWLLFGNLLKLNCLHYLAAFTRQLLCSYKSETLCICSISDIEYSFFINVANCIMEINYIYIYTHTHTHTPWFLTTHEALFSLIFIWYTSIGFYNFNKF